VRGCFHPVVRQQFVDTQLERHRSRASPLIGLPNHSELSRRTEAVDVLAQISVKRALNQQQANKEIKHTWH
jgi:hypothetical protein